MVHQLTESETKEWLSVDTAHEFAGAYDRLITPLSHLDPALHDGEEWPDVILLNGPAGSGKSHVARYLTEQLSNCITMEVVPTIYAMLQELRLPMTHLSYEDFKSLPLGRDRLISVGQSLHRNLAWGLTNAVVTGWPQYRKRQLVVVDNVGFEHDMQWFDARSRNRCLLHLQIPYHTRGRSMLQWEYLDKATQSYPLYPDDSRLQLYSNGDPRAVAFRDSDEAKQELDWIIRGAYDHAEDVSRGFLAALFRVIELNRNPTQGDLFV